MRIVTPLAASAVALCLTLPCVARGQTSGGRSVADSNRANAAPVSVVSPQSPRASLLRYLELARAGDFTTAAAFLDIPDSATTSAPAAARELKAVLDRHVWIDLDGVSPLASGDTADGLPAGVDQIGTVPRADGAREPVRLVRSGRGASPAWRFSSGTSSRVPTWYAALGDRWLIEHLPPSLLRPGPFDLLWWQWVALPVLLPIAALVGWLASHLVRRGLQRAAGRTSTSWDDEVVDRLARPLTAACTLAAVALALPMLGLYQPAAVAAGKVVRAGFFLVFFWSLWRLIDVAHHVAARTTWARSVASSRSLLPLGARIAKVLVAALAAVAILSLLGYPVASLVAGLGLGGLALALAAQKTVENLFGAFSIGVDQPFREGDFVKIEDFVGTVEAIGLRSTRFRTLDRTIVTLPNGRLADMRLESFTSRDRLRLATVVGLVYETTARQIREVLDGFERVLREHPKIWPDAVVVRFREFGASSLDIEIMAWFLTADWSEFQLIRQDVLLQFMEVVERAGTSFAFPTRTLHIASLPTGRSSEPAAMPDGEGRVRTGNR